MSGERPEESDARVTVASRPRRSPAAVEASHRGGRRPRRAYWVALGAALVVAGTVLARRVAHRPRPAQPAAAPVTAPVDPLAAARAAEARGDLTRAAQGYREAYAASGDPELLERLGNVYERLGDRAQAAAYFQRFLDATPHPSEHQDIANRIARLAPPPRPPPAPVCACCADGSPGSTTYLCAHATSPRCTCWSRTEDSALCPQPFQRCTQPPCDQLFAQNSNVIWWNCPDRAIREPNLRGRPGAPCTGYLAGSFHPDDVQRPVPGELACDFCVGSGETDEEAYAIHGTAGAACAGYAPSTGELERGHVCCGR